MKSKKNIITIVLAVVVILFMILSFTGLINDKIGLSIAFSIFFIITIVTFLSAHKDKVGLIEIVMIIFGLMTLILIFFTIRSYIVDNSKYKFQIVVEKNDSDKKALFEYDNRKYYTYNLSDVSIIFSEDNSKIKLKDALNSNKVSFDEILSMAIPNNNTTDYKIYYDIGQDRYDNDEYSIVICPNNDVIFSTYQYKYEKSICE